MKTNLITDIFFDLDDTLWDFQRNSSLALIDLFAKHTIAVAWHDFFPVYHPINEKYWILYRNGEIDKETLRYRRFADSFRVLKLDVSEETIKQLVVDFNLHLVMYNHLLPNVVETLHYLQQDYTLHILTNGFASVQGHKLKNAHIQHYFQTVTASDVVGIHKPHPEIFETALHKAKTDKEHSVMIGDNWEVDILGAINYGLQAVYISAEDPKNDVAQHIKSIAELQKIF